MLKRARVSAAERWRMVAAGLEQTRAEVEAEEGTAEGRCMLARPRRFPS